MFIYDFQCIDVWNVGCKDVVVFIYVVCIDEFKFQFDCVFGVRYGGE